MQRQGVNCPELPPPVGPFSHLVNAGAALYLSGQVAQDPDTGKLIEGDVAAQKAMRAAMKQAMQRACPHCGAT